MFFHAMHKNGGRLGYAPDAIVYEEVVPSRLNLAWVLRRRYRAGQVYAMMFERFDRRAYRRAAWSAATEDPGLPSHVGRDDLQPRARPVVADARRLPFRRVELRPRSQRASRVSEHRLVGVDRSPPLRPLPPAASGGAPRTFGNNHRQAIGVWRMFSLASAIEAFTGRSWALGRKPSRPGGPTHGSTVLAPIIMEFGKRLKESQAIANKKAFRSAFFVRSSACTSIQG